ncbi:hypothetical protein, partial [Enterococcus raffinosus]|uniref:hypothetical protein n=1 Tax=Enterococcus raffinosus TaxID=71452 RepID=UPI003AC05179
MPRANFLFFFLLPPFFLPFFKKKKPLAELVCLLNNPFLFTSLPARGAGGLVRGVGRPDGHNTKSAKKLRVRCG